MEVFVWFWVLGGVGSVDFLFVVDLVVSFLLLGFGGFFGGFFFWGVILDFSFFPLLFIFSWIGCYTLMCRMPQGIVLFLSEFHFLCNC